MPETREEMIRRIDKYWQELDADELIHESRRAAVREHRTELDAKFDFHEEPL